VEAPDQTTALHGLVASYAQFALRHPHLVNVLITEVRNLPRDQATSLLHAQREYIDEWVNLLRHIHANVDTAPARVVVQAALTVINDLARTPGSQCPPHHPRPARPRGLTPISAQEIRRKVQANW
jgi:hypothetical protein